MALKERDANRARPRVKICGVTRPEDAELAVALGADFIGLNFYPPSPRHVSARRARRIARAVAGRARVVAVLVDPEAAEVEAALAACDAELVQLHGDEDAARMRPWASRTLKAFRLGAGFDRAAIGAWAGAWGYLFEARHADLYGGAGRPWRYENMAGLAGGKPAFVAGGITPETAVAAARSSGAWGIDVCSGVEISPGVKSEERMCRLFEELRDERV